MYSLTIVIVGAAAGLIVGLGLGLLWGRQSSPSGQKHREVERKLDQVAECYETASELEPLDAMEKLDIEAALAELE